MAEASFFALASYRVLGHFYDPVDLARVRPLQQLFEEDAKRFTQQAVEMAELDNAAAYLMGYPMYFQLVGHRQHPEPERITAYDALDVSHVRAADLLVTASERLGLDGGSIWEYARVCRELFAEPDWERYLSGRWEHWPDCIGSAKASLAPEHREAIRKGENAFHRPMARLGVDDFAKVINRVIENIPPKPKLVIEKHGQSHVVIWKGVTYPVTDPQATYPGHLLDAHGGWYAAAKGSNERPDRLRTKLQSELQSIIESKDGLGTRLTIF